MSTTLLHASPTAQEEPGFLSRFDGAFLLNITIDVLAYTLLTRLDPFFFTRQMTAKIIAFGLGALASLLLTRPWDTSKEPDIIPSDAVRFYKRALVSVGINIVTMYIIAVLFFMDDIIAATLASIITFALSHDNSKTRKPEMAQEFQSKTV